MATLSVQTAAITGTVVTYASAAGGGDDFPNDGRVMFHVKNADASSKTVTINSITACDQGFDHDLAIVVANGTERIIGPFTVARFGASVGVTYSAVTSVTVAVLKVS